MSGWNLGKLPFFDKSHYDMAERMRAWPAHDVHEPASIAEMEKDARTLVRQCADAGLLDIVVPRPDAHGKRRIDVRTLCVIREAFGYNHLLADAMFTMQGLGSAALWMFGNKEQQEKYLDPLRAGKTIAAIALSEPDVGSDLGNLQTTATRDGDHFVLNGEKTWISNAGIADHYIVLARTGGPGARGLTAFIIDADTPGLIPGKAIEFMAPHPAAPLTFKNCRVPASCVIGEVDKGFKAAMATFDIFRASVGAAGVGIARRALDESLQRTTTRKMFGKTMADVEGIQTKLAEMSIECESAALAVYRAAWMKDTTDERCSAEVSMAKLLGSEAANKVVDSAVQLFGGMGVRRGCIIELLYREARPLRIYEGASEVQKLIIARSLVASVGKK